MALSVKEQALPVAASANHGTLGAGDMKRFPLLFSYRDLIGGNGFFASVEVYGRALLEEDSDGVWMYGLNPGGIAGGGETRKEALSDFRLGYTSVLLDVAQSAETFAEFESEVLSFFGDLNASLEQLWLDAVAAVRSGDLETDWLDKHRFSEDQIRIQVVQVEKAAGQENSLPKEELAA